MTRGSRPNKYDIWINKNGKNKFIELLNNSIYLKDIGQAVFSLRL